MTTDFKYIRPGFGGVGVKEKLGIPKFSKTGINGFSRVNNRSFVVEVYDLITRSDFGPTSLRSIEHIDDKDWREIIFNDDLGEIDWRDITFLDD